MDLNSKDGTKIYIPKASNASPKASEENSAKETIIYQGAEKHSEKSAAQDV